MGRRRYLLQLAVGPQTHSLSQGSCERLCGLGRFTDVGLSSCHYVKPLLLLQASNLLVVWEIALTVLARTLIIAFIQQHLDMIEPEGQRFLILLFTDLCQ